ncbi:MAG TPA: DUF5916 domain-containing protein [Longimicrobium sp.]|nr:DUF5916 domain-containing protein [Longimicrobium sp.]
MLTYMLMAAVLAAPADTTERRTLAAHRVPAGQSAPVVDGKLDDAVWSAAPAAGDFVQQYPNAGAPASQRTEARVVYDDGAVYVGIRAYDSAPDSIAAQMGRRDASGIYSDWVQVIIDSYHDRRTGYRFGVTPRGVVKDVFHFDDGNEDLSWDAVWQVETTVDAQGWTAEFRIPLSQLRFKAGEAGQTWGINVLRDIARKEERSWWSPMLPNQPGFSSRFGTLTGIDGLRPPRRLEVLPYTVASVTRAPGDEADPFFEETDPYASFGADVKYGLSSDFTLTATINPDFGQVEADPSQVNLSAYETFFPERRPFFVEGVDIFRFGLGAGDGDFGSESLFYTRRIGRSPQGMRRMPGDAEYSHAPNATTILGAAKLTGKTSNGWSVGVMEALTAREEGHFMMPDGTRGDRTVEPMTNYAVARVSRDLDQGRTAVGGILTATNRMMEAADSLSFLPEQAYAGGMDFRHRWGPSNQYQLTGWVLGTLVEGDTLAMQRLQRSSARYLQRPDADHLTYDPTRTSLSGLAGQVEFFKSGGHWSYGGVTNIRSAGFEANDMGYMRDADNALLAMFGGYRQFKPGKTFRSWNANMNFWTGSTLGGEMNSLGGNVNGSFTLNNLWNGYAGINRETSVTSVRALRGGPSLRVPGSWNGWAGINSDYRKALRGSTGISWWAEDETDGRSFNVYATATWRASSRAELSLSPSYTTGRSAWQYTPSEAEDGSSHYVFASLDQKQAAMTVRLNYIFAPNLSLQVYGQPFIAAGKADGYRAVRLDDDGTRVADAPGFEERFGPVPAGVEVADPSYSVKEFRSNAVLRWEYRPGSTLFVVWSQGRSEFDPSGDFRFSRDARRLFGDEVPATNVLLVKFNYWLNL